MLRALRRLPCLRGWATSTRTCAHSASTCFERPYGSSSSRRMSAFSTDDWAASTQHNYHHGARCGRLCLHQHGGTSMFEEIFFPRTAERYRAAPLVEQRERYLVHLRETGARRATLRKCANDQLSLVRLLKLKEGSRVRLSQIEAVTAVWSQPKARGCDRSASPKARTRFVNHAVRWLRFLGWLDEADKARHRHGAEVDAYEAWMRGDRGLSEETIRDYQPAADHFLDCLP